MDIIFYLFEKIGIPTIVLEDYQLVKLPLSSTDHSRYIKDVPHFQILTSNQSYDQLIFLISVLRIT